MKRNYRLKIMAKVLLTFKKTNAIDQNLFVCLLYKDDVSINLVISFLILNVSSPAM